MPALIRFEKCLIISQEQTVPYEMFERMVKRWRESFLTKDAWKTVGKKIELSRKAWKEQEKSSQG